VCALDGITGLKDSVLGRREIRAHLRRIRKPGFAVYSGTIYLYPEVHRMGGAGVICPVPLLAPTDALALRDALGCGDDRAAARARARLYETLPVMAGRFELPLPLLRAGLRVAARVGVGASAAGGMPHAAVKEALRARGVPIGTAVRGPLRPLDERRRRQVQALVARLDSGAGAPVIP